MVVLCVYVNVSRGTPSKHLIYMLLCIPVFLTGGSKKMMYVTPAMLRWPSRLHLCAALRPLVGHHRFLPLLLGLAYVTLDCAPVEAVLLYATPDCIPVDRVCMCMCYKCTEQATLEYAPAESILLNATPGRFSGGFLMYIYLPHKCSAQESQCAYCDVSLDYVPVAAEICDMLLRTMLG